MDVGVGRRFGLLLTGRGGGFVRVGLSVFFSYVFGGFEEKRGEGILWKEQGRKRKGCQWIGFEVGCCVYFRS